MAEILDYLIRVRGGNQARREATDAAAGLERLQHAEHEAGDEADRATPKLLLFGAAVRSAGSGTGAVRTNIFGLSGSIGRLVQIATFGAPAIMGLSGAFIALAGSAAAAAGGAGAIGVGGVGALAVGLGGIAAVAAPVISGLKDIRTAQQNYNLAVQQYGYWSKEAGTAAEHLNAVVAVSGGQPVLRLVRQWDSLTAAFRRNTSAARSALIGAAGAGVSGARRLMPAFADATNMGAGAVGAGLRGAFADISGPEVQGMIRSLGGVFARISGPAIRAVTNLFVVFGRVAVAAGPYVEEIAFGFERWTGSLRNATGDSRRLGGIVATLVGHLWTWWRLATAVGRVFFILLGGGAREGRGLVESLTAIVNRFGDWLAQSRRTGALQRFFRDSVSLVRALAIAAGMLLIPMLRLVRAAMPPFTAALRIITPALPILVSAFIGWRVAMLALSLVFRATPFGLVVTGLTLIVIGLTNAYRHSARFRSILRSMGSTARSVVHGIANAFRDLIRFFGRVPGAIARAFRGAPGFIKRLIGGTLSIPGMAAGGVVRARGAALVGEAGPEILDVPQGARVSPLGAGYGGGDIILRVGQRELARVTRREITEQMARGG